MTQRLPLLVAEACDSRVHMRSVDVMMLLDHAGNMTIFRPPSKLLTPDQENLVEAGKRFAKGARVLHDVT